MIDLDGEQAVAVPHAEDEAAPESSAPNIVHVGKNTVTLHPKVTMAIGMAALSVIKQGGSQAVIEAGLSEVYLRFGIESWTFRDRDGVPEPVTPENIERLLPYVGGGLEVVEAADALYSGDVFRPLVARMSRLSLTTQTASLTPLTPISGSKPPVHSARSSRNGTAGKPSAVRGR